MRSWIAGVSGAMFVLCALSGCKTRTFSEGGAKSGAASTGGTSTGTTSSGGKAWVKSAADLDATIDALHESIKKSPMLKDRYADAASYPGHTMGPYDGTRFEACWENPAGKKLTDIQKALYCAVALEVRLCNTPELKKLKKKFEAGTIDEPTYLKDGADIFVGCQKRVDALLGDDGTFVYSDAANDAYVGVFLKGTSGLTDDEEKAIADKYRPYRTNRKFTSLFETSFKDIQGQLEEYEKTRTGDPWKAKVESYRDLVNLVLGEKDDTVL